MVIIIFATTLSIGTGAFLPDPDLRHTGIFTPFSITVLTDLGRFHPFFSVELLPAGSGNYDLNFYLLESGLSFRSGIFQNRIGLGAGGIERKLDSEKERGVIYCFFVKAGPLFDLSQFNLLPLFDLHILTDTEAYTWLAGLGVEFGYAFP